MPGKSKKGGGLESSPVYKKQEFGTAKSPFTMKGYSYPGVSPVKEVSGIAAGHHKVDMDKWHEDYKSKRRLNRKTEAGEKETYMKDVTIDRGFDMDRWIA